MAYQNPYAPVTTVSLPFSCVIPGGLSLGKQIQVQGFVQQVPDATGFSVNLCMGPQITPNCALHFNPRFTEGCIVRNHMAKGAWGAEERKGGLPIAKGHLFEIIILVDVAGFKVAVNGQHFTEFKHRMPWQDVQNLTIQGKGTTINFVKYEGGNSPPPYSPPAAEYYGKPPQPYTPGGFAAQHGTPYGAGGDQLYNPPVPVTHFVPGGMHPGTIIHISGVPKPGAKRFTINLKSGPSDYADVNFHFDVRIDMNAANRAVVVRNHRTAGSWGPEERHASYFPFMPNGNFDLVILADQMCFKVAVNNQHYVEFPHRLPLQNATVLNITGDVKIFSLRFQ